jgi:hypothetical protein
MKFGNNYFSSAWGFKEVTKQLIGVFLDLVREMGCLPKVSIMRKPPNVEIFEKELDCFMLNIKRRWQFLKNFEN